MKNHNGSEHDMLSRLVLGTVQLGLDYGIANTAGKPSQDIANSIVAVSYGGGIRCFDTALAYGESEAVLGRALQAEGIRDAQIISKCSPELSSNASDELLRDVESSLTLLGVSSLYCLMLHDEDHLDLLHGAIGETLQELADRRKIRRIGISVYTPERAFEALEHPMINVLQVPASLFDRRFETSGFFFKAKTLGKEIHIRSTLLQGVLCMEPEKLPPFLQELSPSLAEFRKVCFERDITPAAAALAWCLTSYPDAFVLFGAETEQQVLENLNAVEWAKEDFLMEKLTTILPPQKEQVLSPLYWSR